MRLIIISGRCLSGKSTALSVLKDNGFYCVDNLPVLLLIDLVKNILLNNKASHSKVAVSVDACNSHLHGDYFAPIVAEIRTFQVKCDLIYLDASDAVLLQRFAQTHCSHPFISTNSTHNEFLKNEAKLLEPIYNHTTLLIDTSNLNIYQLYDFIKLRLLPQNGSNSFFLIESFGFKYGLAPYADLVFDVRCLPNPYWQDNLRDLSGLTPQVIEYFHSTPCANDLIADISHYLGKWLPKFAQSKRSYMTVAVGCTGGFHRSVYVAHNLWLKLQPTITNLQLRHRDLSKND